MEKGREERKERIFTAINLLKSRSRLLQSHGRTTTHRGLHFPAIPLPSGLYLSALSRRTAAACSSRRPSRQAEGVGAVRDGCGWFRCRVRGRDPSGGPHRPRPLCRGAPGVPATRCAAARLSRARGQVQDRVAGGGAYGIGFVGAGPGKGTRYILGDTVLLRLGKKAEGPGRGL